MPHTPGPWRVERGVNDFDIVVGNARLAGYIQREADADVMAASPDLLDALREAVEQLQSNSITVPASWLGAIAKAEGRA